MNDNQTESPTFETAPEKSSIFLEAGTILCGNYKLLEPIGRGGMGAIWKARDLVGKRDVALKFVPKDVQNFESEMERVEDVFEVIEKLHHEHICPLYALQKAPPPVGTFLVMQFIPGIPLRVYRRQMIRKNGAFTVENLAEVLRPVASALDYAHSRRPPVIHRDIKPANILVVTDPKTGKVEDVQLIDFGIAATFRASLTRVSQVQMNTSGTRPYMAPEQWQGKFQDSATDQYALAVTAYELLSGVFPFESDDFQILQQCVLNVPASPIPNLLDPANAAILKALSKSRTERFGTCTEFIDVLTSSAVSPKPSKPSVKQGLMVAFCQHRQYFSLKFMTFRNFCLFVAILLGLLFAGQKYFEDKNTSCTKREQEEGFATEEAAPPAAVDTRVPAEAYYKGAE